MSSGAIICWRASWQVVEATIPSATVALLISAAAWLLRLLSALVASAFALLVQIVAALVLYITRARPLGRIIWRCLSL